MGTVGEVIVGRHRGQRAGRGKVCLASSRQPQYFFPPETLARLQTCGETLGRSLTSLILSVLFCQMGIILVF